MQQPDDRYAVYSTVLLDGEVSHEFSKKYLIINSTVPVPREFVPYNCDPFGKLPANLRPFARIPRKDLEEMFSAYRAENYRAKPLGRGFSLGKPYSMITKKEGKERMLPDHSTSETDVITFSDVFFNGQKTAALVYVDADCGGLCGISAWFVLTKDSNGHWKIPMLGVCPVLQR